MTDKRHPGVLGSLPRTRPHRRSEKRPAVAASAAVPEPAVSPVEVTPEPKRAAAKSRGTGTKARRTPSRQTPPPAAPVPGMVETAVQAAAELAEIGLQASARALRRTLSRLPRP